MAGISGLSLIHPGDELGSQAHGIADIVFVHGLRGATTAWSSDNEKVPEKLWLYDLLPKSSSTARIFNFVYQSDVISLANSRGPVISTYAESLLESFTAFRASYQETSLFLSRVYLQLQQDPTFATTKTKTITQMRKLTAPDRE
ncbi:hypothetical protein BOTNAR_0152g00200 [Botryotinia narcissicola]|uniref:DUF676 domain-containing protein n=1 Tax=Botryotinia narcissicola TaxID=278944 RepID=A0A4Z1IF07_9HELO|nr:hypothetical protein BOTNAR_0152g00200 [Botryotinia narcissicola]